MRLSVLTTVLGLIVMGASASLAHADAGPYDEISVDQNSIQLSISIAQEDAARLFEQASQRWAEVYQKIDRALLAGLARGELDLLTPEVIDTLNEQRRESTYMRSAYYLFSQGHAAPQRLHKLVKRFGVLKDAIQHDLSDRIQAEAIRLIGLMKQYEANLDDQEFIPADDVCEYLLDMIVTMKTSLDKEDFLIHEYHQLKKMTREVGTLFLHLSQDVQNDDALVYGIAANLFFQVNSMMAKAHDVYVAKVMRGELKDNKAFPMQLSRAVAKQLNFYLEYLVQPGVYGIE